MILERSEELRLIKRDETIRNMHARLEDCVKSPNTLIINYDDIALCPTRCGLTISVPREKIKQFDTIIINGIKFVQKRSE